MGSRYGGLKQIDSFTPQGDTIMDFSIHDALQAGFGKLVFIIRKSFEDEFKAIFEPKLAGRAEVVYVYQEIENVPKKYLNPERTKPWGTGHALLMVKDTVHENFAIINADDFYGKEAFQVMAEALGATDKKSNNFYTMSYLLKNTISDHGFVSRGECQVDENGYLADIVERTHIERINGGLMRKDENENFIPIDENTVVSMNFFGFTPRCFEFSETLFAKFLQENSKNLKAEFYIPFIVNEMLKLDFAQVKVLQSDAKWFGVTYKADKEIVQKAIDQLKKESVYPSELW